MNSIHLPIRVSILTLLALTVLWLGVPSDLPGQDPWAEAPCLASVDDVGILIQRVEAIVAGEIPVRERTTQDAISSTVVRAFGDWCETLHPEVDQAAAMARLIRYASEHEDPSLAGWLMGTAGHTAYRRSVEWGWEPTELLFQAVRTGRTENARVHAALRLVSQATDPSIQARLLAMIRAREGPPAWRDFPVHLVEHLEFDPSPGARALEEAIHAAPGQLASPRARWHVECAWGRHHQPRADSDPCHPANAPPRPGGE
jgi:hypothetical protein